MGVSVVWIDAEQARVFHISEDRMERHVLSLKGLLHPIYREVIEKLGSPSRIVILGPGTPKNQLFDFMKVSHPQLANKVVACETSDHPSDQQIATFAMKYVQKPVAS